MFEQIKYIVCVNDSVLTHKGFKRFDNLNKSNLRLFNSPAHAYLYLDCKIYSRKYKDNVIIKKIKVIYEVIEDENESRNN